MTIDPDERRLEVSPVAAQDLEQILLRTRTHWGLPQQYRYQIEIDETLRLLLAHPEIGRKRDDLSAGMRLFPVGQHVIYYRVTDSELVIVRVLHAKQNVEGKFDR